MLFNKIKSKLYSKKAAKSALSSSGSKKGFASTATTEPTSSHPNPVVTVVHRFCKGFKAILANVDTSKRGYNPYQLKEQADDSGFDPHFVIDAQEAFYMPEDEDDGDHQEIDKIQDASDKTEDVNNNTDKTEDMNNNTDKTTDVYCDPFENTDTALPVSERLFSAATSTANFVTNNVLWGTMTAVHCVNNGKKTVENCYKDYNERRNAPIINPRDRISLFDIRNNDLCVNTSPLLEINDSYMMQLPEEERKKRIQKLVERDALINKIASYGRKRTRNPIDETWGFIEFDYTVQFKATLSSEQDPSMEAPVITGPTNEEEEYFGYTLI